MLDGEQALTRLTGHALYFLVALLIFGDTYWQWKSHRLQHYYRDKIVLDTVIIIGCIVSAFPSHLHWSTLEWLLRLGLCILILARLGMLVL